MIFPEEKHSGKPEPPHMLLQQAFTDLQANCHGFFRNLPSSLHQHLSSFSHLKSHFQFAVSNFQNLATNALQTHLSNSSSPPYSSCRSPLWARISSQPSETTSISSLSNHAMSNEAIEERLSGIAVYTLCNSMENFVLVSGSGLKKSSVGLFCFKKEDADSLLQQMRSMDPSMSLSTKVVAVPLNKVYQLKANGAAFRFIPEASQITNALREMERSGRSDGSFSGIPVFQSQSLILKSQNMAYRPVFFRKEDLEDLLQKAYSKEGSQNPMPRPVDVQVGAFEEIINGMKDRSCSKWDDIVFIPPGFDISADPPRG